MWKKKLEAALSNPKTQMRMLYAQELEAKDKEIARLRAALESIAKNTCCDKCQEAALVAKKALKGQDDDR